MAAVEIRFAASGDAILDGCQHDLLCGSQMRGELLLSHRHILPGDASDQRPVFFAPFGAPHIMVEIGDAEAFHDVAKRFDHLQGARSAARRIERLMKAPITLHPERRLVLYFQLRLDRFQGTDASWRVQSHGMTKRLTFQEHTQVKYFEALFAAKVGHIGTPVRKNFNKSFPLKLRQGIPDRQTTYTQLCRQYLLP